MHVLRGRGRGCDAGTTRHEPVRARVAATGLPAVHLISVPDSPYFGPGFTLFRSRIHLISVPISGVFLNVILGLVDRCGSGWPPYGITLWRREATPGRMVLPLDS